MKYRVTKKQIEMLANGQCLTMGTRKIYADDRIRKSFQTIIDHNAYNLFDIFIDNNCQLEINEK